MEGPANKVRPLLARLGGAEALLRLTASDNAGGFGMSEVIGAGMRRVAMGLSMEQVKSVGSGVVDFVGEQAGAEAVDKTIVAFPSLSQFT
jgi:hypothetical protein